MRLFITGATGFLGSHVLSAALAAGYEVRALRRHEMSSPVVPLTSQPVWCEGDLSTLHPIGLRVLMLLCIWLQLA